MTQHTATLGRDGFPRPVLPLDRPIRILVGPYEIAGQIPDFAAGFRSLGHQVTTVISEPNPFFPDLQYDVDLRRLTDPNALGQLIASHDLFVFQFGVTLLPGGADLKAIRTAGKAVIMVYNGDDARHASGYSQEFGVPVAPLGDFYNTDPLSRPMQLLRVGERFANLIVSVPNQSSLALRPYQHFAYPMHLDAYGAPHVHDRERPVVVHAPSNKAAKGTALLLSALERIKARGVAFDLQLLEKAPHAQVCDALRNADVAVDQLFFPFGKYAAEAMTLGCAVATAHFPEIEPVARMRPLAGLSIDSYEGTLERLLTDRAWRRTLAEAGPAHARLIHDRNAVAARMLRALQLEIAGTLQHDYYPTFALSGYAMPSGHELPMHIRMLGSEIVTRWGVDESVDLPLAVQQGLLASQHFDGQQIELWRASDGLGAHTGQPLLTRWQTLERAAPRAQRTRKAPSADRLLQRFFALTSGCTDEVPTPDARTLRDDVDDYARLGMPQVVTLRLVQAASQAHGAPLRLAAALHKLGAGDVAGADTDLGALTDTDDPHGIGRYYRCVARLLQGRQDGVQELYSRALETLPRTPSLMVFGTNPIKNTHYWSAALNDGGAPSQTLMAEFYGSINRREDFDRYFTDLMPGWTSPHLAGHLAPYHAFLYLLLNARVFHTSFDGGPLAQTAAAALEPQLLKQAGIKTVVITYGSDGCVYSRVRDVTLRHAFLLSYPNAARREPEIIARLDRWNAHADCILGIFHSIDGHARWDMLNPQPVVLDERQWSVRTCWSDHDGVSGPVRVVHSPNHRGFKGTEFLIAAVDALRAEGLAVELDLVEKVQNTEVRRRMMAADILAEQFLMPAYGLNAIEGMATGMPVLGSMCNDDYTLIFRRFAYLDECPILGATPELLTANLRRLVTDPELRRTLGIAGRAYVEKYHSYDTARFAFGAIHRWLDGDASVDLMRLFHPQYSSWRRDVTIEHPLVRNALPVYDDQLVTLR